MRKRSCRHKYVDDIFPDLEDEAEKFLLDEEGMIVDDCCSSGSGSDTDLSEYSEFDVISEPVLHLMGESTRSKSLVSKLSSETQDSILLLSHDEVNEKTDVIRSKEDVVLSTASASPREFQYILSKSSDDELRLWDKGDYPIPICSVPPAGESSILLETGSLNQNVRCINENNVHGDLRLWNKDDDPIPISIDPPAGESSILLETCSLYQNVSFDNEYNFRGDHIGLEITPISLTKTLEGPNRSLSVCGSLAGRNLPLMEESSGACSSLDENVSSSENRDAKLAQTPSTLNQEEVNGEDEICFSDIDAMVNLNYFTRECQPLSLNVILGSLTSQKNVSRFTG